MGGNEDSFCHFDLTLNSRDRGIIDSCATFSFCRGTLKRIAQSEIVQEKSVPGPGEHFVAGSRILALPCPPLGNGPRLGSVREGSGTYVGIRCLSYLIVLFGHHQLVGNARGVCGGIGEIERPRGCLLRDQDRVLGVVFASPLWLLSVASQAGSVLKSTMCFKRELLSVKSGL